MLARPTPIAVWCFCLLAAVTCDAPRAAPPPSAGVAFLREVGLIPNPPGCSGRDVGFSARLGGHSAWIFGDTFFPQPAADGYTWRSSTWSYTDDSDASDGLSGWTHGLGADGKPLALLPHTAAEQAFDDAHDGDPCPAGSDCGARHTPWPAAFVVDPSSGQGLVFYQDEQTGPTLPSFVSVGTSIATWSSPDTPAVRPVVSGLADETMLFTTDEPNWDAAAVLDQGTVYVYACDGRASSGECLVARAPFASALDHSAWHYWTGSTWSSSWHDAIVVLDGAPLMSIHYSPYLAQFVAYVVVPLTSHLTLRTAPRPEGPWSAPLDFAEGAPPLDGTWDYGLIAHPELAREGGRVEYVSYFQPGKFLDGTIHLVEVTYE